MQSAWFVYLPKSPDIPPDGLADGAEDEPLDDPPVAPGDVGVPLPEPEPPVVPEGLLEPVPDGLLAPGADEPLPVCAAARAGTKATSATRSVSISFCIFSSRFRSYHQVRFLRLLVTVSKIGALVNPWYSRSLMVFGCRPRAAAR
jgi:hypothetical protein